MGALCGCCGIATSPAYPRLKDGEIPTTDKVLTDYFCLILFLAYMGGMVCCILYGFKNGNPSRMINGVDFAGKVCGIDYPDQPFAFFCGSAQREPSGLYPSFIYGDIKACVASCPTDNKESIPCMEPARHSFQASTDPAQAYNNMKVIESFNVVVAQTVSAQLSYPTEEFGGRFCVPRRNAPNDLYNKLVQGAWYHKYKWGEAFGTLEHGWPVLIGVAVLAILCGYLYLYYLGKFAGLVMLMSMVGSAVLTFGSGLFFIWAVFVSADAPTRSYQSANPFYGVYTPSDARGYSILLGIVCIVISLAIVCITQVSIRHIDEMVGLVDASRECIMGDGQKDIGWKLWPLIQSGLFLGMFIFFIFIGLPFVMTTSSVHSTEFQLNGVDVDGIRQTYAQNEWEKLMILYYCLGCLWLWEVILQLGHMTIASAVSQWYFTHADPTTASTEGKDNTALFEAGLGVGKNVKVRIAGADNAVGERVGVIKETSVGKTLIIPVSKRGPGVGRTEINKTTYKKEPHCCGVCGGLSLSLIWHLGSLALAAPMISLTRPFRMITQTVQGVMSRTDDPGVKGIGFDQPERSQQVRGFCALLAQLMDFFFGKWSKMGLTQMVLNGGTGGAGYFKCCADAFELTVNSGGTLAYLHSALLVYEYFGIFIITIFCTLVCMIVLGAVPPFCDREANYYVEDRVSTCMFAAVISGVVAFSFMSLFNHTADVLLFDVTWNRRMNYKNPEDNEPVTYYAPGGIRALIGAEELNPSYEEGLSAHTPGQVGALQHALEAGVLQSTSHSPSYFKMNEGGHGGHGHGGASMNAFASMGSAVMQQYLYQQH